MYLSPVSAAVGQKGLKEGHCQGNSARPPGPTGWGGPEERVNLQTLPSGEEVASSVDATAKPLPLGRSECHQGVCEKPRTREEQTQQVKEGNMGSVGLSPHGLSARAEQTACRCLGGTGSILLLTRPLCKSPWSTSSACPVCACARVRVLVQKEFLSLFFCRKNELPSPFLSPIKTYFSCLFLCSKQ